MALIYTQTSSRSKKPKKLTAAQRQLQAEWEAMQKKWASQPKLSRQPAKKPVPAKTSSSPVVSKPVIRPDAHQFRDVQSKDTGGGSTAPVVRPKYSGDGCLGISTMHKSNLVPVFSKEDAVAQAKMRRG